MPTPNEQLVLSWQQLGPSYAGFAADFYHRLFTLEPGLRGLFRNTDMLLQQQKLTLMLDALTRGVVSTDAIVRLGRRHTDYGVQPQHYDVVAAALLWALQHNLGPRWTMQMQDAWQDTLTRVADLILNDTNDVAARGLGSRGLEKNKGGQ